MENTERNAELFSLLRMIQVIPEADGVGRVYQLLLSLETAWRTIGLRRAFVLVVDERQRVVRGHLAAEHDAEAAVVEDSSLASLADRVLQSTEKIEASDLTLKTRAFSVPLDWHRSAVVKAAETGAPVLADRRMSEFASDPFFDYFETPCYVAIPIQVHDRVTAVLAGDNGGTDTPVGVEDVSLVYSVSQHASAAIERLIEASENARKFRVLRKLQDMLANADDPKRFGEGLTAALAMIARAVGGTGALLKDLVRNRTTHVKSVDEMDVDARETDLAIGECFDHILDRAAGGARAIRGEAGHALLTESAAEVVHHFQALPLCAGGECLGAMAVYAERSNQPAQPSEFSARDRLFLELCAGLIGERLDSIYKADRVRRIEEMFEEARSNWVREKSSSDAGSRAHDQYQALVLELRRVRDELFSRLPFEKRVARAKEIVSRVEADAAAFHEELEAMNSSLEMLDLFALVRSVAEEWAPSVRSTGVEVSLRVPVKGPFLLMHHGNVERALKNILRVLARNVKKGDRVLVECSAAAGKAVIVFADTAKKVDGSLLSRLFMPFAGAGDESDPKTAMSVAGDILQRHAGEITVRSSPSWKTILAVSFPAAANRDRRQSRRERRRRPRDRRA